MLRIVCPHCGPRAQVEFVFDRALDAVLSLDASPAEAVSRLYERDNPRGWSWELWRHTAGCGAWLKLHRHTVTHEIDIVETIGGLT
jgi:heterotetrameric sarcosine oxidase delta subunit